MYLTVPYLTVPYRTLPYLTVPYRTVPYRTVPYRTVPYRTVPYRTVPYRTVPYRTVPYLTVPYLTVPYCCERHKLNYVFIFIVTKNRFEFIFSHSSHRDLLKANLGLEKYKILFFSLVSLCFYSK
jgi:hypothetical protein